MIKNDSKKREKQSKILMGTAILLGLILIYNIISLTNDLKAPSYDFCYEVSFLENPLRNHDYPELMKRVAENESTGSKTVEDSSEYIAFAHYYESISYYSIFKSTDAELASRLLDKSKDYRGRLKTDRFLKEADLVDEQYHIN